MRSKKLSSYFPRAKHQNTLIIRLFVFPVVIGFIPLLSLFCIAARRVPDIHEAEDVNICPLYSAYIDLLILVRFHTCTQLLVC